MMMPYQGYYAPNLNWDCLKILMPTKREAQKWINNNSHKALAKKPQWNPLVLLKNEHGVLPLSESTSSIAVIGTDAVEARLGGYSGPGNGKISILDGIKERAGSGIKISYAPVAEG